MSFGDIKATLERLDCIMKYITLEMSKLEPESYKYNELLISLGCYYEQTQRLLKAYSPLCFCFMHADMNDITDVINRSLEGAVVGKPIY